MGLFDGRAQRALPDEAVELLSEIPSEFRDDGLSLFPDRWFGFNFKWAGRIHDWEYCTRCHDPGVMTVEWKVEADRRIGRFVSSSLPVRWKWLGTVVRLGVWRGGYGSFDSCGPNPSGVNEIQHSLSVCRHNMPKPAWFTVRGGASPSFS